MTDTFIVIAGAIFAAGAVLGINLWWLNRRRNQLKSGRGR